VDGGLARLRDALARLLADLGVVVHTGATVSQVLTADGQPAAGPGPGWPGRGRPGLGWAARGRVGGVLVAGERVPAHIVVCGADSARLYRDLWPSRAMRRRIARIGPSSSGFLVLAALRGRTSGLAHHNVIFSADYRAEFADIFGRGRPPADPTIYVGCPAAQDPATAPPGHEGLTLLVNVPAASPGNWGRSAAGYAELLLGKLDAAGLGVRDRVLFTETLTPADFEHRYDGWLGSIYGTSHNGRLAPFRRPGNRGPLAGLYLVGGSVHPGGGLPLVVIGSRIVADLVTEDLATGRL
jgi:phytoene desaturase